MQMTVIDIRGDMLYLEVPGQLRFRCLFRKAKKIGRIMRNDAVDVTLEKGRDRLTVIVHRVLGGISAATHAIGEVSN
jgi:hypothetical protein